MPLATIGSDDCMTKVIGQGSTRKEIEGKLLPFVGENPSEFCQPVTRFAESTITQEIANTMSIQSDST